MAKGAGGLVLFAVACVLAAVLLLPGSLLIIGGGFVYGPLWGLALVSPVSVLAATAAFLLGRTVARDRVTRRLGHNIGVTLLLTRLARRALRVALENQDSQEEIGL